MLRVEAMSFEEPLGVLCLGGLVGVLLAIGLTHTKPTLRAVVTVIGAGAGGAPVAFLAASTHRWLYPIGLILGFLWVRIVTLYKSADAARRSPMSIRPMPSLVVTAMAAMVIVTIVALTYTFAAPKLRFTEQMGDIHTTGSGTYEVFYAEPLVSPPTLTFPPGSGQSEDIKVLEQRSDGFKIQVGLGTTYGAVIKWRAVGRAATDSKPP